jgi:hypothetical protein
MSIRLGQIVVHAARETALERAHHGIGRQRHDRRSRGAALDLADALRSLEPVHHRHLHVHENERVDAGRVRPNRLCAVVDDLHVAAQALQIARQAGALTVFGELAVLESIGASALRAEPQRAAAIFEHGAHANLVEPESGREMLEAPVLEAAQAGVGADPETAVARAGDRPREIPGPTLRATERRELAVAQAEQAAAVSAHPEAAFEILVQRTDVVARHCAAVER